VSVPVASPPLRSDARRNRRRLLEAAREVMREHGLEASLGEIARRAGVGNATLYRHFPTREALCEAVFAEYGSDLERIRDRVLAISDPWDALAAWLEETCAAFADDQAFADLITHGMPQSPALNEVCVQGVALVQTLLDRAQRAGAVRPDVELTDVLVVVCSLQRVIPAAAEIAPDAWRRHLVIALDGLRPRAGAELPAAAMSFAQFLAIGERLQSAPRGPVHREVERRPDTVGEPGPGAISDELWGLIEPELPGRRRDHRQTLEAILWRYRTGCSWRDLPAGFGSWQTLWKRHRRWADEGVYQRVLERLVRS
jgi:AcrR family transcriptional regulator